LRTNTSVKSITITNVASGDYFLIPPGTCGPEIISILFTNVVATTNVIVTATNTGGYFYSQSVVILSTNHVFAVYPCTLVAGAAGYYQGIQRVQFVRVPDEQVDSLTGNLRWPLTNIYSMVWFNPTNHTYSSQVFQRIVARPDILFRATDLASPNAPQIGVTYGLRNLNFDQNNVLNGLAGPGIINPSTTITYNEVGDIYGNGSLAENLIGTNAFLSQFSQSGFGLLAWASFDASTNDPVVYPNDTSIQNIENQLIISITPTSLPDGTNGVAYPATPFSVTGGQSPYRWSLATGSQPLPFGLSLSSGGVISGTPSGNPPGVYDFAVQMTDDVNRVVSLNYSITIH
jgi:hypothetical protein